MYGDEYYIAVLISEFHNLLHPSHIVPHTDKTSENTHSVVYMHYIVPYVESVKVIQRELFALVHRTPKANPVETVEYFVVGIAANLIFGVNETVVDVAAAYELRYYASVLQEDGTETLKLGFLFAVDVNLISAFYL